MGVYRLNLCGFEKTYLQKLSLYLKKKMGEEICIGIWDEVPKELPAVSEGGSVCIWLGGRESIQKITTDRAKAFESQEGKKEQSCFLTLCTERNTERSEEIYAYQSAEVILDFILRHAEQYREQKTAGTAVGSGVEVLIDLGTRRSLLSCGAVYAQEKGERQKVLLIDLVPCSALTGMLTLPVPEKDFTDLILTLRKKKPVHISEYIVRSGNIDILPAACNPSVLYELTEEDFRLFLIQMTQINCYDAAVILAGTPMPGIGYLFVSAKRVICLQDESSYAACRKELLQAFYRYSGGDDTRWKDLVLTYDDVRVGKETGEHLLFEWRNQEVGKQVRQELMG